MSLPDRTYIITEEPDELLELRLSRSSDSRHIHLWHNGGTKTFDIPTAMKLRAALMAVLSGSFDRAITETAIRLEAEEAARRASTQLAPPTTPTRAPNLEDL